MDYSQGVDTAQDPHSEEFPHKQKALERSFRHFQLLNKLASSYF